MMRLNLSGTCTISNIIFRTRRSNLRRDYLQLDHEDPGHVLNIVAING